MTARANKCSECETPLIGEQPRCPRCHEDHARAVAAFDAAPLTLHRPGDSLRGVAQIVILWIFMAELLAAIGIALASCLIDGC